jgi:DNA-binding transcriptional ArsR family regulator
MREGPDITRIAALIGDPARAVMLGALMGGRALTAGELAVEAGITPATASSHLARLSDAGLLCLRRQGRHRYYALAGPGVAAALETLSTLAADAGHMRTRPGPRDPELRQARVCYDHLAGALGVRMFRSMAGRGHLIVDADAVALSDAGATFVTGLGIDLAPLLARRRPLCRVCLDWSERRSHLGGALGAAMLDRFLATAWLRRRDGSRAIEVGREGAARLDALFPEAA